MKIKTEELNGPALDWAVAKCEGKAPEIRAYVSAPECRQLRVGYPNWASGGREYFKAFSPSTDWSTGGPIIDREKIATVVLEGEWRAFKVDKTAVKYGNDPNYWLFEAVAGSETASGPTMLVAGLRAFVQSKLGDEVDAPDDLAVATGMHVFYETKDADRPKDICDSNGEVVLTLCKRCGRAESELLDHPSCDGGMK